MKRVRLTCVMAVIMLSSITLAGQTDSAKKTITPAQSSADSTPALTPNSQATIAPKNDSIRNSKNEGVHQNKPSGYPMYWLIGCGLLGIILGAVGYKLFSNPFGIDKEERRADEAYSGHKISTHTQSGDGGFVAEQKNIKLEELNRKLNAENDQLKRDKTELEHLLRSAQKNDESKTVQIPKEIIFYMPQPNMNGKFQEASKRADANDALYAFRVKRDNPTLATFEFIAKDAYLNAAIGNEPTWIAIACDRSNQPSATTSRVRTDSAGKAVLKDGEWEIKDKAKITYL